MLSRLVLLSFRCFFPLPFLISFDCRSPRGHASPFFFSFPPFSTKKERKKEARKPKDKNNEGSLSAIPACLLCERTNERTDAPLSFSASPSPLYLPFSYLNKAIGVGKGGSERKGHCREARELVKGTQRRRGKQHKQKTFPIQYTIFILQFNFASPFSPLSTL